MPSQALARLNPLRVSGTALPPNLLLGAKIATIAFLFHASDGLRALPDHFIPFVTPLMHLGSPAHFHHALDGVAAIAAIALLLNQAVRAACLALAGVVLLGIASTRGYFHVNHLYFALFMLFLGLYDRRIGTRLLRYQLAVVYAGAALNKVLDSNWRDGTFVANWLPHYIGGWHHVFTVLPGNVLPGALGWLAILTEILLVALLLTPRLVPLAAWLGVAYHTTLVTITAGNTFGLFWYTLLGTYLALMPWPPEPNGVEVGALRTAQRRLTVALQRLDLDGTYRYLGSPRDALTVRALGRAYAGPPAWARLILYLPALYLILVTVIVLVRPAWVLIPASLLVLVALALPSGPASRDDAASTAPAIA